MYPHNSGYVSHHFCCKLLLLRFIFCHFSYHTSSWVKWRSFFFVAPSKFHCHASCCRLCTCSAVHCWNKTVDIAQNVPDEQALSVALRLCHHGMVCISASVLSSVVFCTGSYDWTITFLYSFNYIIGTVQINKQTNKQTSTDTTKTSQYLSDIFQLFIHSTKNLKP